MPLGVHARPLGQNPPLAGMYFATIARSSRLFALPRPVNDTIFIVADPPQADVHSGLVARTLRLDPADVESKLSFRAPEVFMAGSREECNEAAGALRHAGLRFQVLDGRKLATVPSRLMCLFTRRSIRVSTAGVWIKFSQRPVESWRLQTECCERLRKSTPALTWTDEIP